MLIGRWSLVDAERIILNEFGERGTVLGDELLFVGRHVALECLDRCEELGFAVIGINGFVLHGDKVEPRLDFTADWSDVPEMIWPEFRDQCNRFTRRFLEEPSVEEGLVFELVIVSEEELSRGFD